MLGWSRSHGHLYSTAICLRAVLRQKCCITVRAFASSKKNTGLNEPKTAKGILGLLLTPGTGQHRPDLDKDAARKQNDFMVWSHLFFVPPLVLSAQHGVYELCLLQSAVLGLSVAYHVNYERPGLLAQLEGTAAKLFFVYGLAQLVQVPSMELLAIEASLSSATLGLFILTNVRKDLYETVHPVGLHCIPGVWASVVACTHQPFFF
jgi:hypothetical protein